MLVVIDPSLFVKFVLLGLLISGLMVLGWLGLKALFKWLKKIGM